MHFTVEQYSIDETFADMTGTEGLFGSPIEAAHRLKDEIRDTLGFTVNVGISSNKLLAKMAGDFEKPDKVHTLFPDEIQEKLERLDRAMDSIREKFGADAVRRASFLQKDRPDI